MERWNLANVEFMDVPVDLSGYAHGLLMSLTAYMKSVKAIHPDESLGGVFVAEDQSVIQLATARRSPPPHDPGHEDLLRIVDIGDPAESRFPCRLFASYLIVTAERTKNPAKKIQLLRQATRIYPGDPTSPSEAPPENGRENPNNYVGWKNLGTTLCEEGHLPAGISCLERAVALWPAGARDFAAFVRKGIAAGEIPAPEKNPISRFWMEMDISATCLKVRARSARDGNPAAAPA